MHFQCGPIRRPSKTAEIRGVWVQRNTSRPSRENGHGDGVALCCAQGGERRRVRRKSKAKKRARAQRQALIEARRRRAQTAAARAAHSARTNPTILRLRGEGLSWARIAQELDGLFEPPGWRGRYPLGDWHASAAWRIARRHRAALHDAEMGGRVMSILERIWDKGPESRKRAMWGEMPVPRERWINTVCSILSAILRDERLPECVKNQ